VISFAGNRVVTFALTADGLTAFRRQLRANDAVAVEAGQAVYYFYDHIHERVKEVDRGSSRKCVNASQAAYPLG
jgi:hypothetical protein